MTPLPVNPKVVILTNQDGKVLMVASNIAPVPELVVEVVKVPSQFDQQALGMPFNQLADGK